MTTLVDANNKFGVDLLKQLMKENPKGNTIISSLSISAALGMVELGAAGDTAEQMEKVLHFNEITASEGSTDMPLTATDCDKPGGPHAQFKALLSAINQHTKNYALSIANRLYGSDNYQFKEQYLHCTKKLYNAELERVDFLHATEEVRKKINSWIESQTNGKIKDLFPSGLLDPSAVLVLVNAIYFKGTWKKEFNKKNTHEAQFWIDKNQSKKVQMMFQEGEFKLAKIANPPMQVVQLPFANHLLSMYIFLPDSNQTPEQLERKLTYAKLKEWTSTANMQTEKVHVYIPKFKLEEKYQLKSPLSALGMTDVFTEGKADLSGMSESRDLVVSKVIHQSYIEVSEEGTEAAAGTGVEVVPGSATLLPEFRVDHPFLFYVKDNITNSILFSGKCSSPQ